MTFHLGSVGIKAQKSPMKSEKLYASSQAQFEHVKGFSGPMHALVYFNLLWSHHD